MRKYKIFFELYGKKMKTTIIANSKSDAIEIVKNKIVFHKIVPEKNQVTNDFIKNVDEIFNKILKAFK